MAVVLLVAAAVDLILRYLGGPHLAYWGLGFLQLSLLAGLALPVVKLPAFGLGQPRRRQGGAPLGTGLLTIVLLAFLANGMVQAAFRRLEVQPLDAAMPHDVADAVFAILLTVSVLVVALRMFAGRKQG